MFIGILVSTAFLIPGRARAATEQVLENDNGYRPTWGLDLIDQRSPVHNDRYIYAHTGQGVTVYVLDSGVNSTHVEFGGRVVAGYSAIDALPGTEDCSGHGTISAGLIGSQTYGVAKGVTIVPIRVLNCSNTGTTADVIEGINWMIDQHQTGDLAVANMSLSGGANTTLDDAVNAAIAVGIHVVVSAGNRNNDACGYSPSRVSDTIVVGGLNRDLSKVSSSSYGTCLDIWAPGADVVAPWWDSTTSARSSSGTSVAAPFVTGAVALLLEEFGAMSATEMSGLITGNATTGLSFTTTPTSPDVRLYVGTSDRSVVPATTSTTTTTTVPTTTTTTTTTTPSGGSSSSSNSGGSSPRTTTTTTSTTLALPLPALATPPTRTNVPKFVGKRCKPTARRSAGGVSYRCTAKGKWILVKPRPATRTFGS
jgi:subtilisin family serine protease